MAAKPTSINDKLSEGDFVTKERETREKELLRQADSLTDTKLKMLSLQKEKFMSQVRYLKKLQNDMKTKNIHKLGHAIGEVKKTIANSAESLELAPVVVTDNLRFTHEHLPDIVKHHEQFGRVSLCPVKFQSGRGIEISTRRKCNETSLECIGSERKTYVRRPDDKLANQFVACIGRNIVVVIFCKTTTKMVEKHIQHTSVNDLPMQSTPLKVITIPDFSFPSKVFEGLSGPWGVAVRNEEIIVAESNGHCISVLSPSGARIDKLENDSIKFSFPCGLTVDEKGNILALIEDFHYSSASHHDVSETSKQSSSSLDFKDPTGICVHPLNQDIYVADTGNHRIQVLHPDLTYSFSFGCEGSKDGELLQPYDVAIDNEGHVYVVDYGNHRIQVYSTDGKYLRQFGEKGNRWGDLCKPASICIYSNYVVYVGELGNNRTSIFTIHGEFIKYFGFGYPHGLATDCNGTLYVSDKETNYIYVYK